MPDLGSRFIFVASIKISFTPELPQLYDVNFDSAVSFWVDDEIN